jgi:UDP-N-acetylglucosamine 2-epimerase (non-hydrolysing)
VTQRVHLAVVLGTRPEVIKLAPVVAQLRSGPDPFRVTVIATGQHREMLDQALAATGLAADRDLDLMRPGQTLSGLLAAALIGLDRELKRARPDGLLVQGDTTSALAGALAAFHLRVPVAHVEAGLRSHDPADPFPEEANRRLISGLAAWHFAPTPLAARNLRAEGVNAARIAVTGNPVVDALRTLAGTGPLAAAPAWGPGERRRVLVTAHRRESFGRPLREICAAVLALARRFPDAQFVLPVHPNPEVRRAVRAVLRRVPANLRRVPPLPYGAFIRLLAGAALAITDSGGVQEEATALNVPCLVLRRVTERPEALAAGARLVPPEARAIAAAAGRVLAAGAGTRPRRPCPFGDGRAAARIAGTLAWVYGLRRRRPKDWKNQD